MTRIVWAWMGALSAYLTTHLLFFGTSPGFHYDEAWAANFSLQIAETPGFWPIQAMSPQTHAWHHYLVALLFKLFGPSVEVFRLAHLLLHLSGVILLGRAISRFFDHPMILPLFIFLAGIQPALVTNHRFAIELTSFHVLCFGGMAFFSLSRDAFSPYIAAFFCVMGLSSHIFFLAPALALLGALLLLQSQLSVHEKRALFLAFLFTVGLSIKLLISFPEKDKAHALISLLLILFSLWLLPERFKLWRRKALNLTQSIRWLSILGLPLVLFLIEGHWGILAHVGLLNYPWLAGLGVLPWLGFLIFFSARSTLQKNQYSSAWTFWALLTIATISIAPKPTGRYFETLFLTSLGFFAALVVHYRGLLRITIVTWGSILFLNLFIPAHQRIFSLREYRFLFFHDHSRDFLPKAQAIEPLIKMGCTASQVKSPDDRTEESIRFLLHASETTSLCDNRRFRAIISPTGLDLEEDPDLTNKTR